MAQADGLLVVAGLALVDGRVLLGKRKATGKRGGLWECPGGKVDPGENPKDALIREWREELGMARAPARSLQGCQAQALPSV